MSDRPKTPEASEASFPAPKKTEVSESLPQSSYARLLKSVEKLSGKRQDMAAASPDRSKHDFPNAPTPCDEGHIRGCRTACCTLHFELSPEDLAEGFEYEPNMPYAIRHEADGYCYLLDRNTHQCSVWQNRPKTCRIFDCRKKANFKRLWED